MHVIHLQLLYLFAGGKYGLKEKKHLTQHLEIYSTFMPAWALIYTWKN